MKRPVTISQALEALEAVENLIADIRLEYELNDDGQDPDVEGYKLADPAEDLIRNSDNEDVARKLVELGRTL